MLKKLGIQKAKPKSLPKKGTKLSFHRIKNGVQHTYNGIVSARKQDSDGVWKIQVSYEDEGHRCATWIVPRSAATISTALLVSQRANAKKFKHMWATIIQQAVRKRLLSVTNKNSAPEKDNEPHVSLMEQVWTGDEEVETAESKEDCASKTGGLEDNISTENNDTNLQKSREEPHADSTGAKEEVGPLPEKVEAEDGIREEVGPPAEETVRPKAEEVEEPQPKEVEAEAVEGINEEVEAEAVEGINKEVGLKAVEGINEEAGPRSEELEAEAVEETNEEVEAEAEEMTPYEGSKREECTRSLREELKNVTIFFTMAILLVLTISVVANSMRIMNADVEFRYSNSKKISASLSKISDSTSVGPLGGLKYQGDDDMFSFPKPWKMNWIKNWRSPQEADYNLVLGSDGSLSAIRKEVLWNVANQDVPDVIAADL